MSAPETLKIDDVEYVRKDSQECLSVKEQRESNSTWPWKIGAKYCIRTVTMIDHGTLVGVTEHELVLQKAAWIPDTGRWWNFITKRSKPTEVEPFHPDNLVIIGRGSLIDATQLDDFFGDQK